MSTPSMTLFHNPASPFVRKVRVLLAETGQQDRVALHGCMPTPVNPDAQVVQGNPVGKIPALRLADGTVLHDSRVILDYFDHQHVGNPLIPRDGAARWRRLTLASMADGIMDAAVLVRYETAMRPVEKHWDQWLDEQRNKIRRTLAELEANAIAELAQNRVRHVERILRDEIDADAFGPDQAHDLFDLFQQGARGVVEQQVGLVEEEDQARPVGIAHLRQLFEQLRQQPQQEGPIQARAVHQPRGVQHIDLTAPVEADADHVLQLQGRFTEEGVAALLLKLQQGALDGGDGGGGDIADLAADPLGVLAHIDQQTAQIAQVQADKKMSAKDKKDALADLNEALKSPPPAVENKGNIDIVTKSYDKLMEEFGGSDDN